MLATLPGRDRSAFPALSRTKYHRIHVVPHLHEGLFMLNAAEPERSNRIKGFVTTGAGDFFRKHCPMFGAVRTPRTLEDIPDPCQGLISSTGTAEQPEMEPDKMFPGITEDRFNPAIVFNRLPERQIRAGFAAPPLRDIQYSSAAQSTGACQPSDELPHKGAVSVAVTKRNRRVPLTAASMFIAGVPNGSRSTASKDLSESRAFASRCTISTGRFARQALCAISSIPCGSRSLMVTGILHSFATLIPGLLRHPLHRGNPTA